MRRFQTYTLDQPLLLAPFLQDWLPEDHLARFIVEIVSELDLNDVSWGNDARGAEVYHPEMLTRLLLYGCATGLASSHRIEMATYDSVPFRYLAGIQRLDRDTIATIRQQHLEALMNPDGGKQKDASDESAQFKEKRGIREFRIRGFKKTKTEWLLICLTHNLLNLYRHDWPAKRANGKPDYPGKQENERTISQIS